MKKYSILVASALASLTAFTSCDDSNDCGCSCGVPVIESVEKLDAPGVNIAGGVEAGSYVAILGKNLGDVTSIQFGERNVAVKAAYRSDNSIIIQIPSVTKSCTGTMLTSACPTGFIMPQLGIIIGTPTVYMMYNEFAADGDYLMLKGSSFVGDQMQVDFHMIDNTVYTAQGEDIQIVSNDGSQMYVKVPFGASAQQLLTIRNAAENKESVCNIIFRDTRNMLIDFDTPALNEMTRQTGQIDKATDGTYSIAGLEWADEVPALYSVNSIYGVKNNFGVFQKAEDWKDISFAPEAGGAVYDDVRSVYGPFKQMIMADPASAANYVVKFEVAVPETNPTDMMTLALGFMSASQKTGNSVRNYAAALQMSKVTWDKSDAEAGWKIGSVAPFSTFEGKWMTVQIPMSEFMWNLGSGNYITSAQNFTEGNFSIDTDQGFFGDATHADYVSKYSAYLTNDDDLYDNFGGFAISFNPYDGPNNGSATNINSHFTIDNIRIVPNDGNGAYYPKLGWGSPKVHYFDAPRKTAFGAN